MTNFVVYPSGRLAVFFMLSKSLSVHISAHEFTLREQLPYTESCSLTLRSDFLSVHVDLHKQNDTDHFGTVNSAAKVSGYLSHVF